MKVSRLLAGASESTVITGMPWPIAASISGPITAGSATDTMMPEGLIFSASTCWNASCSALGSYESGPTISAFTPICCAARNNPVPALCQ